MGLPSVLNEIIVELAEFDLVNELKHLKLVLGLRLIFSLESFHHTLHILNCMLGPQSDGQVLATQASDHGVEGILPRGHLRVRDLLQLRQGLKLPSEVLDVIIQRSLGPLCVL